MVRVRTKKINPKSNLTILRETDLPEFDGDNAALEAADRGIDANTGLPKVESGVESKEEKVRHVIRDVCPDAMATSWSRLPSEGLLGSLLTSSPGTPSASCNQCCSRRRPWTSRGCAEGVYPSARS